MENTQENIQRQYNAAQYIMRVKQPKWLEKAKSQIPVFAAEYLFHKNPSKLTEMLRFDEQTGYKYDPEILHDGIEMLFRIFDSKDSRVASLPRLQSMYSNFETPEVRVHYLRIFAEYLELYPIIGNQMIADLQTVGKTTTDPDFLETLDGRIKSVKHMMKTQAERSGYQPE